MKFQGEHQGDKTIITVRAERDTWTEQFDITGVGEARCRPDDVYSDRVGEIIALGRAIQDFGRQLEEIGVSKTVTIEDLMRVAEIVLIG